VSTWSRLTAPLRRARWKAARWSTDSDRAFHDALFAAGQYDPFTFSYPGYLTIRRFADLAEQKLRGARHVLDLGCGPGEITCELARRQPDVRFTGVDHSSAAIARAAAHAARLGLANVEFQTADLETFAPAEPVDAVLMFDAFHHLLQPEAFVERLRRHSQRFFLIEPAGDWKGSWNRDFDLDWLPLSMFRIRDRLEQQLGIASTSAPPPASAAQPSHEEPTERRYAAADFERFFAPWPVEIAGTIAGLQEYGPRPFASSPVRDEVGELTYDLVVRVEEMLRRFDADLAAKHWTVYAAPDAARRVIAPRVQVAAAPPGVPVQGPYDARYAKYEGPVSGVVGEVLAATIEISNLGWETWTSAGDAPFHAGYQWLDTAGRTVPHEGLRAALPGIVAPGGTRPVALRIKCPDAPGRYTLAIEMVREGVTWFSEAGVAPLRVPFNVRAS
jgi:SAM-dependent methyltransferase